MAPQRRLARVEDRLAGRDVAALLGELPLILQLVREEVRRRRELAHREGEDDRDSDRGAGGGERPPAPAREREHHEPAREREQRRAREGEEETDGRDRGERGGRGRPAPEGLAGSGEQERDGEQECGRERAEEGGDQPAEEALVAVEGEVLRHPARAVIVEAELLAEVARHLPGAPTLDVDRVHLDEPDRRDGGRRPEHRPGEPREVVPRERQRAAEQVGAHGKQRVTDAEQDRLRAGVAVEQGLRDERVHDDDGAEAERRGGRPRPARRAALREDTASHATRASATASSSSFHAWIAVRAAPSTPQEKSAAMTALWSARPTTNR